MRIIVIIVGNNSLLKQRSQPIVRPSKKSRIGLALAKSCTPRTALQCYYFFSPQQTLIIVTPPRQYYFKLKWTNIFHQWQCCWQWCWSRSWPVSQVRSQTPVSPMSVVPTLGVSPSSCAMLRSFLASVCQGSSIPRLEESLMDVSRYVLIPSFGHNS